MLVFAGDGPMRDKLLELGESLGVGDRPVFAGNQNQASLAQLIPQCAAVLSPLTGRALSEYALSGAAIVAYDLDWRRARARGVLEAAQLALTTPSRSR